MTKTDIPPGGEGKIEVTFKPGRKKGDQRKTVRVMSNDPANPTVNLTITAFVEVDLGFDPDFLNLGEIGKQDTVVKRAHLSVKDPEKMKITEITTSSPFITVRPVNGTAEEGNPGKIEYEVKVLPGLPPGRINETVTVHTEDPEHPTAFLKIRGNKVGDVTVNPEMLHFKLVAEQGVSGQNAQDVEIVNRSGTEKIHILSVEDPDDRMDIDLTNVEEGVRYRLTVKPKPEVLAKKGGVVGAIKITTDDPEEKVLTMRYSLVVR